MSARAPAVFDAQLLDRCISCGFCLPACPTYAETGVETSSPRGRINLMRALEDGRLELDDPTIVEESSFCLGCRACEPVCPAGVQYGALLEQWRDAVWTEHARPWKLRLLLAAVARTWRVRALGALSPHTRRSAGEGVDGWLMLGCFERVLLPGVSRAAKRLAPSLAVTPAQGCCGALHAHNGELQRGRELARELGRQLPGTIVTTSGGCAAHLAGELGADRVLELSQWLTAAGVSGAAAGGEAQPRRRVRIALQDSCHLRNGLGVHAEPRALIASVGEYVELPSAARCCGAAGTYALLRPRDSRRLLDQKLDEIEAAGVDIVVAVNPGCLRQLRQGLRRRRIATRALHLAELLAETAPRARG